MLLRQESLSHLWQVYGPTEKDKVWVAAFPDLYVMRWLSPFLKHVFPRSMSNARAYSRVLWPSASGSVLLYPIPPCTSLYPVPALPKWPFQSPHGIRNSDLVILAVTAPSWSKKQVHNLISRLLCRAYKDRKLTTHWLTISFTKMILLETQQLKNFLNPFFCHKHSYTSSFVLQLPPQYWVSRIQQTSTSLLDSVSTALQTLPLEFSHWVFPPWISSGTCLICHNSLTLPNSWQEAKSETLPTELWCLLALPYSDSIVEIAIKNWKQLFLWDHLS